MDIGLVVVVEDDDMIRTLVSDFLAGEGYDVQAYRNGREALEGLRGRPQPCLILLDLMMPVLDGWEFLRVRRSMGDVVTAVPVYIFSAVGDPTEMSKLGAQGYLKKPFDADLLLKIVSKHCGEPRTKKAVS